MDTTTTDSPQNPNTGPLLDRTDWVAFWSCFILALVAYFFSLPPTVTLEDAGELAVAGDYLGVPHPPGYPSWTLLAWLFQWVFHFVEYNGYPNPAWSIAFMSAFFGALACGCTSMLISKSSVHILDALAKPKRSLLNRNEWPLPLAGLVAALLLGGCLLFLGSKLGMFLLVLGLGYIVLSFTLHYFNGTAARYFMSTDGIGSFLYGFFIGLLLFCAFWTNNSLALGVAIALIVLTLGLDYLIGKAAPRGAMPTGSNLSWIRWGCAFAGGMFLAFSPLMWSQAVIVEVYSLNAFFMSIILLLTYLWMCRPTNDKLIYVGAFLFGLGLTNHQSLVFLVFFLLAAIGSRDRLLFKDALAVIFLGAAGMCFYKAHQYGAATSSVQDLQAKTFFIATGVGLLLVTGLFVFLKGYLFTQWKRLGIMAVVVVLGLSFHGYMPVASEQNPPMNWGYPRTQQGFKHALFRGQYEKIGAKDNFVKITDQLGNEKPNFFFFQQLGAFFYNPSEEAVFSMVNQFSIPITLIGIIPLLIFWRLDRQRQTWISTMAWGFFSLSVLFLIAQYPSLDYQDLFVKRVQYIQAHALYAVWIAYGLLILYFLAHPFLSATPLTKPIAVALALGIPAVPLHMNFTDEKFIEVIGSCELTGHDYGWQFGYYQLRGAKGIVEELDPDEPPIPNPEYPPEMEPNAIFYGGTDPGRFVPTYMIYSAKVREDVFLITQNALADNTYMNIMRDLYGNDIWIPSQDDSNRAFAEYVEGVKSGRIAAGADVNTEGGRVQVQGVGGVMKINGILCRMMHDHNKDKHAFYVEESYVIPWMYPYLTPHGLIMKLNAEPTRLTQKIMKDDFEFWEWYKNRLLNDRGFKRDPIARKTFSKLRSALGGLYAAKGQPNSAVRAFKQAIDLYPLSPEANFRLAEMLMKLQRHDEAIEIMESFSERDPRNKRIPAFLKSLKQVKNINKERLELEAKVKGGAVDLQSAFKLMGIYSSLKMKPQLDNVARVILKNKKLPAGHYKSVCSTLEREKRYPVAMEAAALYVQKAPNDYRSHLMQARIALKSKKSQETLQALAKAVEVGGTKAQDAIRAEKTFRALANDPTYKKLVPPKAGKQLRLGTSSEASASGQTLFQ